MWVHISRVDQLESWMFTKSSIQHSNLSSSRLYSKTYFTTLYILFAARNSNYFIFSQTSIVHERLPVSIFLSMRSSMAFSAWFTVHQRNISFILLSSVLVYFHSSFAVYCFFIWFVVLQLAGAFFLLPSVFIAWKILYEAGWVPLSWGFQAPLITACFGMILSERW